MPVTYTPSAADAQFHAFAGQAFDDPVSYTSADAKRIDAKYCLKPLQDEILALNKTVLALPSDQKTYACLAGLAVNDPVYLSAADTVSLALADTAAHSLVLGFVAYKPTATSCILRALQLKTGLSGLTAGAPVYLTDAGAVAAAPGTVVRALGIALNTTDALLFVAPAALTSLCDVNMAGLADGYTLAWDAASKRFVFAANATTDEKVKADAGDPTAGKLDSKVDGITLEVDTSAHVVRIKNSGVTYSKIQNVSATDKLLGRSTAGAGVVEEIACTAAGRALIAGADAAAQRITLGVDPKSIVSVKTAAYNIADPDDKNTVFSNEGAAAEAELTLPGAAAGMGPFFFAVQDADGIKVRAGTGDTIRIGAGVSSAAGYAASSTIGSTLMLVAINATEWLALSSVGTWSVA